MTQPKRRLSALEKLPLEVLTNVFVKGLNPSLALASRTLLDALSTVYHQKQLGESMLCSRDPAVHSDLLRRRFLSFALYRELAHRAAQPCAHEPASWACPYNIAPILVGIDGLEDAIIPHFSHPQGTVPPARLLHNFPEAAAGRYEGYDFEKFKFLLHLLVASVCFAQVEATPELRVAACHGIEEALAARSLLAAKFLIAQVKPPIETLMRELVERDCPDMEMAYYLLRKFDKRELPDELLTWALKRDQRERDFRNQQLEEEGGWDFSLTDGKFVGLWLVNYLKQQHRPLNMYSQYVMEQSGHWKRPSDPNRKV